MKYKRKEIKKGINLHLIQTQKFKTNLLAVFLTTPITKENVTKNALISSILRRGSKNMPTLMQISQELEEMYGASFDCGIDKTGDNQILKFYLESINDKYLPQNDEKILEKSITKLLEIVFNPILENGKFKEEYVVQEKENIKRLIEGQKDNKALYSYNRCVQEMYADKPYGLYKYGNIEDIEKIDSSELYEQYKKLINECKIDIFISGDIEENLESILEKNEHIESLKEREPNYIINQIGAKETVEPKEIIEELEVTQGKLVIGLDMDLKSEEQKYDAVVYNAILGGTANSKMFQEVREKASLAYTAGSSYLKYKDNIFIKCGIEINNYEKALKIIKEQLQDMEDGKFTDEDINNAKKSIISTIKGIDDEQDTEITYFFGQELSGEKVSIDEYINKIEKVTKEKILEIAKSLKINTIYFLKNIETAKEVQKCK